MKKFKASIARWTADNPKTNAFYDVGLKSLIIVYILKKILGGFPIHNIYSFIPVLVLFLISIVLLVFDMMNFSKRRKNGNMQNINNANGSIAIILSFVGILIYLITIILSRYSRYYTIVLLLIALVLLSGSIVFYVLGYKELLKAEKSQ